MESSCTVTTTQNNSTSAEKIIKDNFWFIFTLILIGGFLFRLVGIEDRPFHNDEGVNYFFLTTIDEKGYYEYSHENYHGPSYFYWTYLWYKLCGDAEWAIRISATISGMLSVPLLLLLRRSIGSVGVLCLALGVALLPSHFYYSRYAIHETLFVTSALGVGLGVFYWLTWRAQWAIYLTGISAAIHCATKETFIITYFSLFFPVIGLSFVYGFRQVGRDLVNQWHDILLTFLLFCVLVTALFTAGFKWNEGLNEMWRAVPQWVGRNSSDTGHFKPFYYYTKIISITEPWLFCVVVLPLITLIREFKIKGDVFFREERKRLPLYLSLWTILSYLVYSFLNYKTPWLIINFTVPAILATIAWGHYLFKFLPSSFSILFAIVFLGGSAFSSWWYALHKVYGEKVPYSYVHTTAGVRELTKDIDLYLVKNPTAKILIGVDGYWPLPYYLRKHASRLMYLSSVDADTYYKDYAVMILEQNTTWQREGWARKYYRLSEVEETYTYFKRNE